jgi:hypothetical protein
MSASRHPVALRLQRSVGGRTRLLATVMLLPLVDGIFPALVLAGALDSAVGVVQVGLLVFGGSATLAVVLAEMDADPRRQATSVLAVGGTLIAVAAVEAALAPTIESVLHLVVFERFAGLVIVAVAAKTASARVGEYLPRPAVIVGLGALASLQPAGFELVVRADPELVARAAAAGLVGTTFALGVVAFQPYLRGVLDIDRFRFGSAVALGVLAFAVLGLAPENAPLAVLAVAGLLAFDPGADGAVEDATDAAVTDGGEEADDSSSAPRDSAVERAPWL